MRFRFHFVQDVRVYHEEAELDGRDPQQDFVLYKESCESLASLMSEIQELKANGTKEGVSMCARKLMCHYRLLKANHSCRHTQFVVSVNLMNLNIYFVSSP